MKLCSLLLSTVSHFWCIGNSSAPQFCANLSGMMTNCVKLHYSFTSTAWIWCKTMPDCAKERRLHVGIWCKTMPDCANERRLNVKSTDVLDITLWQNKQQLSGFHYSEKKQWQKISLTWQFFRIRKIARTQWCKKIIYWAASTIQRKAMTKNNTDLAIFQNYKNCQDTMIQNKQQLSGFHYSEKSNDKKIPLTWMFFSVNWCKTMPDCANARRLNVESTDVLDITLWQIKQQLSGFH